MRVVFPAWQCLSTRDNIISNSSIFMLIKTIFSWYAGRCFSPFRSVPQPIACFAYLTTYDCKQNVYKLVQFTKITLKCMLTISSTTLLALNNKHAYSKNLKPAPLSQSKLVGDINQRWKRGKSTTSLFPPPLPRGGGHSHKVRIGVCREGF